jgi:hypothetical protein
MDEETQSQRKRGECRNRGRFETVTQRSLRPLVGRVQWNWGKSLLAQNIPHFYPSNTENVRRKLSKNNDEEKNLTIAKTWKTKPKSDYNIFLRVETQNCLNLHFHIEFLHAGINMKSILWPVLNILIYSRFEVKEVWKTFWQ